MFDKVENIKVYNISPKFKILRLYFKRNFGTIKNLNIDFYSKFFK